MLTNDNSAVSEIEKQFWLLDQQGQGRAYQVVSAFVAENLDVERLVEAVNTTVSCHPVLQSTFKIDAGELRRFDAKAEPVSVVTACVDDSGHAVEWLDEQVAKPFDLAMGPLIRLLIANIDNSPKYYFAVVIHHIVVDLHSKQLLAAEITDAYNSNVSGPRGSDNFIQYVAWQNGWLRSPAADKARSYWRERVASLTRKVGMPEQAENSNYFETPVSISNELTASLQGYCQQNQTDPFIVVFAAYYFLLSRFSGLDNFAIGVPLSNRKQADFKNTFGCFVNTLPISLELGVVHSFSELRQQARKALLGAHRHQELPSTEIIKLATELDGQRQIYNVGFTFEQPMDLALDNVVVQPLLIPAGGSQLDCFLRLWNRDGRLEGRLETHGGFWSQELAQRFAESLQRLLASVVQQGLDRFSDLDYLPTMDLARLNELNQTTTAMLANTEWQHHTLLSLFERQVAATPDQTALVAGSNSLDYRTFDALTNRFAHSLQQTGVRPGDVVAVYCQRSLDMIVAIYGIVKAGAAYLPIDIALPVERIRQMLQQADVQLVAVGPGQSLPEGLDNASLLCNYHELEPLYDWAPVLVSPDDPAYVIFTSGSTGLPKGVVNKHSGIVNRLLWMQDYFKLTVGERVLQKTPYSFDVSVWELFWPLQAGATLVLADHDSHKNPYQLLDQIRTHNVQIVHFVPSMLAAFTDALNNDSLPPLDSLRAVVCSGEELTVALQNRFKSRLPECGLYNLYGPTEAAVDVSYWQCGTSQSKQVPIGKPVANTSLYVVDADARPVPLGVVGELWIGGVQVAAGYINNPDLSAERFIANPFAEGRVYKTGDYVRWNKDGQLEYFGRKDFQVKLNGLRIELGEIENVLASQPGISVAAVMLYSSGSAQRLVAYYATESGKAQSEVELRNGLAHRLPSYMVPSQFIHLAIVPLSSSGKILRSALPLPMESDVTSSIGSLRSPETATQRAIWNIWSELLDRKQFGIDDSFFELGGDSMLLMAVYQRLQQTLQTNMNSVDMFRFTSIRQLAEHLAGTSARNSTDDGRARAALMQRALSSGGRGPRTPMR